MSRAVDDSQSLLELFRVELDNQARVLTAGLLALESDPVSASELEKCMRAAHSLKGAARIVDLEGAVRVAHAMEDGFVGAQQGRLVLHQHRIDLMLAGVDWLTRIADLPEAKLERWPAERVAELDAYLSELQQSLADGEAGPESLPGGASGPSSSAAEEPQARSDARDGGEANRIVRVSTDHMNRLLGLSGELLIESRRLQPFADSLLRLRRMHAKLAGSLERMGKGRPGAQPDGRERAAAGEAQQIVADCRHFLSERLSELELFTRRANDLSRRLYDQALASRMRPFADRASGLPRMVRDLGRTLGKQVRLEVTGERTPVDRDILERLDAPLTHLLRNAVDHGIETPEERRAAGKPAEAAIQLDARHSAGMLQVSVSDDGRGVALERLRQRVVERNMMNTETAARLTAAELLEFLFLPGFTLKDGVDEISGRGVGLDVVQHAVKQVGGVIRVHTEAGKGTRFQLQLPLTLSVVRALLVEIGGEPYAFPLVHVECTLKLAPESIERLEGREHFDLEGKRVGLVTAHQILRTTRPELSDELPVVVIGDVSQSYGLVVDRMLGERELVVHQLDPRLGKIKDVAAGALLDDGTPALIVDVEDLMRSAAKLAAEGRLDPAQTRERGADAKPGKRILVVDDSFTVRELERKLLENHGYQVEVAVDGMDGWNAVRIGEFDLLVTDVDMPRLDGIELVGLIRRSPQLQTLPVLIVSYKDREDDRRRGLDAGADYYLTKSSFQDERLIEAVVDLIGEADS